MSSLSETFVSKRRIGAIAAICLFMATSLIGLVPPAAAATSTTYNFDSGLQGWASSGSTNDWEHGTSTIYADHTGSGQMWGTKLNADYSLGSDSNLDSPPIVIDSAGGDLVWWAVDDYGYSQSDEAGVWVSTDNGVSWVFLWGSTSIGGGHIQSWSQWSVSMSAYAGQTIKLRFRFIETTNGHTHRGWYVDDITVPGADISFHADAAPGSNVGQIQLTWTTGPGVVTAYNIYRGTTSGSLSQLTTALSTARAYTDSNLMNGTRYYYAVAPLDGVTEGARTEEVSAKPKADTVTPPANVQLNPTRLWIGSSTTVSFSYTVVASQCPTLQTCPVATAWEIWQDGLPGYGGTLLASGTRNHAGHANSETYTVSQTVTPSGVDGTHSIIAIGYARSGSTDWSANTPTMLTIDTPLPGTITGPTAPTLTPSSLWPGQALRVQSSYTVFQKQCPTGSSCPIANDWMILLDGTSGQPDGTVLFSGSNNHPAHGETQTYTLDRTHTFGSISVGSHLVKVAARLNSTASYQVVTSAITIRGTVASTTLPEDFIVHPPYMFSGNARVAFNYSVTSMTCAVQLSCDTASRWSIKLDGTPNQNGDFSDVAFDGTLIETASPVQPSHGETRKNAVDQTVSLSTLVPGPHFVKSGARPVDNSAWNWRVQSKPVILLAPDDGDNDGVSDTLEAQLCGREIERILISSAPDGSAGACVTTLDYDPPADSVTFTVPSNVMLGPDADRDGFPAYLDVYYTKVFINRTDPASAQVTDGGTSRHPIDMFETDSNRPVIAIVCTLTPFPSGVSANEDADNDGFPHFAAVTQSTACVDRRAPTAPFIQPAQDASNTQVDPNDNDPNNPVQSYFNVTNIPVNATFSKDNDRDGLPGYRYVRYANLSYDRRDPANPVVTYWIAATKFDPNDNAKNDPIPFAAVDNDGDFIPDAAEPSICLIQDANMDEDGDCVAGNYLPPSWYQMVLDRVFA